MDLNTTAPSGGLESSENSSVLMDGESLQEADDEVPQAPTLGESEGVSNPGDSAGGKRLTQVASKLK